MKMSEQQADIAVSENLQPSGPLPVSQRPESIAFGAFSLYLGSTLAAEVIDAASNGLSTHNVSSGAFAGVMAGLTGVQAIRSHKETVAYNHATEEERNAPRTLGRRYMVRTCRSTAWAGGIMACGEFSTLGIIKAIGAENIPDSLPGVGIAAVAGGIAIKMIPGFRASWIKQRHLKKQWEVSQPEYIPFVSKKYEKQLNDLAAALVTPERFSNTNA